MLRTVLATRYVTPLKEGGSLPGIVEAEDFGLYVLKFRGAGQGRLALAAELIAGEIGRALGLPVPEIVLMEVDEALGRNEADEEVRDLLRASVGLNLALDYLPGSMMFDAAVGVVDGDLASRVVWFDSFVTNVDRTARNPNLLWWHKRLYLIDHGAALYFHHDWRDVLERAKSPFSAVRNHVLLRWADRVGAVDEEMRSRLRPEVLEGILRAVPDDWLTLEDGMAGPADKRRGYLDYFGARLAAAGEFVEEVGRARARVV